MGKVELDSRLKAIVGSSYITALVEERNNRVYTISGINPGDYRHSDTLQFPFIEGTEPLLVNTPIEVVLLGTGVFGEKEDDENDISSVLTSITGVQTLFGVRVPEGSEYFDSYKVGPFVTGVVYHIGKETYPKLPAYVREIQTAHEMLYSNTKDTRFIPEGLDGDDLFAVIAKRIDQQQDITWTYIAPRDIREVTLGRIF